jgi:Tfp pilus assembly protein PilF
VGSEGAELREAERLYRRALEQDETYVEARIRLGRVLGRRGRHDEAARQLRQAIAATKEPLLLYYANMFLGAEAEALRRLDEARDAFARAGALYPAAQSPRLAMSALSARAGDRAAALQALEAISSREPVNPDDDPWWGYFSSQARNVDRLVNEMYRHVSVLE